MRNFKSDRYTRLLCGALLMGAINSSCSDDDKSDSGTTADSGIRADAGYDASVHMDGGNDGGSIDAGSSDAGKLDSGAPPADDAAARLTEAQVVGVAAAINMGEIQAGALAQTKATSVGARDFATMMVTMHTAAQQRQTALGVTAAASPTQAMVTAMAAAAYQTLESTPAGAAFDVAYLRSQVQLHTSALMLIDTELLPSATTAALREELMRTRADVVMHLASANALLSTLSDGGVEPDASIVGTDAGDAAVSAGRDAGDGGV